MYRPDGWENPHWKFVESGSGRRILGEEGKAYEAGADAMLEALRGMEIGCSKEFHQLLSYPPQGKTGRLVFILDEGG